MPLTGESLTSARMNDHTTLPSTTSFVHAPGGRLALRHWGTTGKPVMVLVHGYPDNSSKWEAVAQHLREDFDLVAYDVRGAGESFKPQAVSDYQLARLTEDFTAVINAVSPDQPVHLVAHDWGSVQSWEFVTEPALKGRIASYTSCSGPSLDHAGFWMRDRVRQPSLSGLGQLGMQSLKSWYIYFFQLPWLPEALWRGVLGRHWPSLMRLVEGTRIEPRASQAEDGAHGINLYRANVFACMTRPRERFAHAPVLLLVAMKDRFVSPSLTADLARWVPRLTRRELNAGHWVTLQQPQAFAQAVREFIAAPPVESACAEPARDGARQSA